MADYRWGDVLPIEQGGGQATTTGWGGQVQPAPQQQPQPQADQPNFLQRLLNPQVMAGLAGFESAFRGGNAFPAMQKGMEMGMQQEEARRQAVQRAALQNLLQGGKLSGLPPALQEIAKVTGDAGPINQYFIHQAAAKLKAEAEGKYGKQGAAYIDPKTGMAYTIQFGSDGTRLVLPVTADGVPLATDKGVKTVDTGTGTDVIGGSRGETIRSIPKDIVGRETDEKLGQAAGAFQGAYPKLAMAQQSLEAKTNLVRDELDQARKVITNLSTGLAGKALSVVPGTDAYKLKQHLTTIMGNIGFDELQQMRAESPTGGALGSIAVQELTYLQAVRGSLEQAQTPADLKRVMDRLEYYMNSAVERRRNAFEMDARRFGGTNRAAPQVTAPQAPPVQQPTAQPPVVRRKFNLQTGDFE